MHHRLKHFPAALRQNWNSFGAGFFSLGAGIFAVALALSSLQTTIRSQETPHLSTMATGNRDAPVGVLLPEFTPALPPVLSALDARRYRTAFAAVRQGNWADAEALLSQTENPILKAHVEAAWLLSPQHTASYEQLAAWLSAHQNRAPDAYAILALAERRKPAGERLPVRFGKPDMLQGYGDHSNANTSALAGKADWNAGLNAWRAKDYQAAANHFTTLAQADNLSDRDSAAVNYWAWRALKKMDGDEAEDYLERAAAHPRSLYGILANRELGNDLPLRRAPKALDSRTLKALYEYPGITRAVALVQAGAAEQAEQELRAVYPRLPGSLKEPFLGLAHALELPGLEMRLAVALSNNGEHAYDFALYPTPSRLEPHSGFAIDPALIFSFARQESGFNSAAKSESGALGLMQIMPGTARYVAQRSDLKLSELAPAGSFQSAHHALAEPVANMTLGQSYVSYLLKNDAVQGNILFLAAAYNAGPGKLAEWQCDLADSSHDPLLFLESIPYRETRNFVTQILTSYWIYSDLMGRDNGSALQLSRGQWPRYEAQNIAWNNAP